MGFNAGITCLQDPDHTDRSDLSLLVKSRMGKSNFRFVDKGIGVRKLETAPVSWIWPPCLHRARGILPRQCFRRRWIYCSLTENAEQVGNCAAQRQTEGEKHKLWKNKDCLFFQRITLLWVSQKCPVFLYLQFSVLSHCQRELCLNISERFMQTKPSVFVKYSCKTNKEQKCP